MGNLALNIQIYMPIITLALQRFMLINNSLKKSAKGSLPPKNSLKTSSGLRNVKPKSKPSPWRPPALYFGEEGKLKDRQ